jgi:phosphatidylserine/phosphatidylglycerophosphate/cardiolipin synthase-like enzyme
VLARTVVVIALLTGAFVPGAVPIAAADAGDSTNATLVAAYPNPVARDDPGEFVTVRFDGATNTSGWTLTDGKTTARLPNRTFEGTVAFSMDPEYARNDTDHPVEPLAGRLLLADDGDRLRLRDGNETISVARYRNAPESELRDFDANEWRPIGATDHDPIRTDGGSATAFVLPDAPDRTVGTVRNATDRIHLAGYTFTSERLADVLLERANDGVEVRVLLDGAPVGGMSARQARQLDRLVEGGIDVRLLAGPHRRYRHHHPKYAVVDDAALVSTENFKPAGTGGMSSRGWSVVLHDRSAAAALATVHESDWGWRAATPWLEYRSGRDFIGANPALGGFEPRHEPERVDVDSTTVLVAPDNAAAELVSIVDAADDRVLIQQVRIDSRENELLRATLRAADRGARVRIHLGGSWYVEEDNARLAAWLNRRADAEEWDLEARVDDADGYEKIHTKGVIADETVVVGSLNWVRSAQTDNREVLVALNGDEPAAYYASVFTDDWRDGAKRPVPGGLFAATAIAVSGALLLVRRMRFVGEREAVTDWQW